MRTGAIFARGSCRALKWMALFGIVFALAAGQAAAQVKVSVPKTVGEGGRLTISVSADIRVPASGAADTMTIAATVGAAEPAETGGVVVDAAKMLTVAEPADFAGAAGNVVLHTPRNTNTADHHETTLKGTIELQFQSDQDAEDEGIVVTLTLTAPTTTTVQNKGGATLALAVPSGGNGAVQDDGTLDASVTIDDTDDQTFVWSNVKPANPNEGADIMVTLAPKPTPVDLTYATVLSVDHGDYTVSPSSYTFSADDTATADDDETMHEFAIKPPNPDGDRDMDTIMVSAFVAGSSAARVEPQKIEVADIHGLPMADKISAKAYMSDEDGKKDADNEAMSVMEGAEHPVHVTVTADRGTTGYPSGEKLKVAVMGAAGQGRDYRVEPSTIEIASGTGEKSATFKLWALEDEDIGAEELMLTLEVMGADDKKGPGKVMVPFSIMIEDATEPWVSVKDDAYDAIMKALGEDPLNRGAEVMVMTDDLFMYDADMYNVSFAASVEGGAVSASSSGEAVTIMAKSAGDAKVTVTATAAPMGSSLMVTQDRANVAQLTFPVSVVMSDLSVAVTADPMEIMEGGMSTITAMASREIAASDGEVKVDLEVIGDGELSAASITIEAGSTMGTATVTAMEDDDDYEDETLTVVARGAGSATLTIMVTDDDEAPEPTNLVTAKSSEEIQMVLEAAGLGDDDMFNPGATTMVDASMLFDAAEGVSVSYAAESDDMAAASTSVSGSMVSVMAGMAGHAHITITATATMASGIEIYTGQPATNVATVLFSVNVTNTPLAITVSTDPMDMVEEGGTITVTATANRDVVADDGEVQVTLTITGAVEMNEAMIAIAAGSSNSTMIQVLDDMEVAPMADITIVATGSGIATAQTFTIAVTENDSARTFTLSAPDDMMNLVEGGDGVELTVTADPAVSMDTEVMIMVDRAASTAGADDFTAEPVMIMAGETSGTTMLMATEDGMDDSGHASPEMLVVFAMADNTQSNSVSFYIWDMAVPALPIIAQLLLAFFLAIGGYRRYLRR